MTIVSAWIPSPNRQPRNPYWREAGPDLLVLHFSAGTGDIHGLGRLFAARSRQASAHYGVGRTGLVGQYVSEREKAWHAGDGLFPEDPRNPAPAEWQDNVNDRSIGIEVCNRGFAPSKATNAPGKHRNPRARDKASTQRWERYTPEAMVSLAQLIREVMQRNPSLKWVTGHEDVCNNWTLGDGMPETDDANGGKLDPGPFFPWEVPVAEGLTRVMFNFATRRFEID